MLTEDASAYTSEQWTGKTLKSTLVDTSRCEGELPRLDVIADRHEVACYAGTKLTLPETWASLEADRG